MNVVKVLMLAYVPSKNWIYMHGLKREEFINDLNPVQGINYSQESGTGGGLSMDEKNTIATDEIDKFDNIHRQELNHHRRTLSLCEIYIECTRAQYRELIYFWMTTNASTEVIAERFGYSIGRVSQVINDETDRVSFERLNIFS